VSTRVKIHALIILHAVDKLYSINYTMHYLLFKLL